jgi:hypothetical protein
MVESHCDMIGYVVYATDRVHFCCSSSSPSSTTISLSLRALVKMELATLPKRAFVGQGTVVPRTLATSFLASATSS